MIGNIIIYIAFGIMCVSTVVFAILQTIEIKRVQKTANFLIKHLDDARFQGDEKKVEVISELLNNFLEELKEIRK